MSWYCDNDAAVGETTKVRNKTQAEWLRASNTDIGMYLESLPRRLTKCVKAVWRRGHPEERMSPEKYTPPDWLNVCCDTLASKVPHGAPIVKAKRQAHELKSCVLFKLPGQPAMRALYMSHPIVSKVAKTTKRYIQTNSNLSHLAAHRPKWAGPDTTSDIDWPA
jgi:hypothetical protein